MKTLSTIISGISENTANQDFHTIKYTTNGLELWNIRYNSIANGNDNPFDIAIDSAGDVIVAGQTENNGSFRYISVKYIDRAIVNPPDEEIIPSSGYFTENNGQLVKTNGQLASEVKYIGGADYPKVYVQDDKLSYVFHVADSLANDTVHRIDMVFNERKKTPKMHALDKMDFYQNYYLPTVADGKRERVESFKKLIGLDVWDNIDLMISHNNKGLKYYLICKPGFSTADLGWKYEGATSVSVNASGELVLTSSIGSVIMPKGEAYEVNSSGTRIDKSWQPTFSVSGSDVSLGVGSFNANNTLVIEIDKGVVQGTGGVTSIGNMLWNSYYGGASNSYFNDVDTDKDGNTFIFGESFTGSFPLSTGQILVEDYSGGRDVIVLRLNVDVEPQWLSYFGGSGNATTGTSNENAESIKVFEQLGFPKQVYICGYTNSDNLTIEDNNGAYVVDAINECNDGYCHEGYIAQFNENGTLEWSTYYGGLNRERLYGIDVDKLGNIYAVGFHETNAPLVSKSGADNYTAGDGLILQYAPSNRALVWATSWDAEIVTAISIDNNNNIYTTGHTDSPLMPVLNYDPNYPVTSTLSGSSSFVNKFNAAGQLEFSFFIANQGGVGSTILVDYNLNLTVGGHSSNSTDSSLPLIGGFSNSTPHGNFIVKMDVSGAIPHLSHSTFFSGFWGNYEIDFPAYTFQSMRLKFDSDDYGGNLYVFGTTIDKSPYPIQQPPVQPANYYVKNNLTSLSINPQNFPDNYIAAFDGNLNLLWSTYHGSNLSEYSGGIAYSESQQRIVVVGSGWSGGVSGIVYDYFTFEATEYDDINSDLDYYQQAIIPDNMFNGFGAMFDINGINQPLDVDDNHGEHSQIKYWPNPTSSKLTISAKFDIERVEVYDVSGRLTITTYTKGRKQEISTYKLESGVYLVNCYSKENVESFKFIKL